MSARPDLRTMSGLEAMTFVLEQVKSGGAANAASIGATLGFDLTEVGEGLAVFTGFPSDRILNPLGTVHGGFALTLIDSCTEIASRSTELIVNSTAVGVMLARRPSLPTKGMSAAATATRPPITSQPIAYRVLSSRFRARRRMNPPMTMPPRSSTSACLAVVDMGTERRRWRLAGGVGPDPQGWDR